MATRKTASLKTNWDLGLMYKSPRDPTIERDMALIEKVAAAFRKKYAGKKDWLSRDMHLAKALGEYEKVYALLSGSKPALYFWLTKQINAQDIVAEGKLNKYSERLTKAGNEIIFFELALGKLDKKRKQAILTSKVLLPYRYFLHKIFEQSKHHLSESEEKVLSLKSMPSRELWIQGVDKLISKQGVRVRGKEIPISEAIACALREPKAKDRRALYAACMETFKSISDFAESELNALVIDKKIDDELRGFENPYDATILGYENDAKSVLALVEATTKNFKIAHRFYDIKRRMHGLSEFTQADRGAEVGKSAKKIPFKEAYETIKRSFDAAHPRYGKILEDMAGSGLIDAYPKKGKEGGAFHMTEIGIPSFILLNHTDDFRSLTTFAHEMGHAIHSERSRQNRPLYQHYTIAAAETASTFFEGLVFDDIFNTLPEEEKIVALHNKIQDSVATIFRQIAFFNFEKELHSRIREEGSMSKEAIAALFNKHMASYMGPKVLHEERDGYFFVTVGHFRRYFYVYTYTYGALISKALLRKCRENPSFIEKIDQFLSAGGSDSPENIFQSIGINTTDPKFFEAGLKSIEEDVKTLEKLVAKSSR